jgi:hypothetical protein
VAAFDRCGEVAAMVPLLFPPIDPSRDDDKRTFLIATSSM